MRHRVLVVVIALAPFSCERSPGEPRTAAPAPRSPGPTVAPSATAPPVPAVHPATGIPLLEPPSAGAQATLTWTDPPGWQRVEPASRMRRAQYNIPRAPGDDADAGFTVITFGAGQGGDTNANLERWYGSGVPKPTAEQRGTWRPGTRFPLGHCR